VKNQLTKIIYPFVEATSDVVNRLPPLLLHLVQSSSSDSNERRLVAEIFHVISSVIPRISDLISADYMSMSEAIVIQAVYVAIGPFFVAEGGIDTKGKDKKSNLISSTLGTSAMRGLHLDALALIRSVSTVILVCSFIVSSTQIFANHEDQRGWIIEEILSSLIKLSNTKQKAGQFR
jgi:cohesin loading factor subunit SCC2